MEHSTPQIYTEFLPISRADMEARGWEQLDFVVVGGDAYVDHPSFGTAIISRLLEAEGYKVGVLAQPRYTDCEDFKRFGKPKYGFFIGGGNVDSMVQIGLALHGMLALCAQSSLAEAETTSARQVILQAAETLRKNYQQELCLADLLAEAHMSKSYFLRLFRRYMGTTPYNYLVNFRITQAKELLVLTDHSVGEIAQKVGFGDASNFSTRFAKATGQSPLQYRKSALKPQEGTR